MKRIEFSVRVVWVKSPLTLDYPAVRIGFSELSLGGRG
jgi:hypothetical protein